MLLQSKARHWKDILHPLVASLGDGGFLLNDGTGWLWLFLPALLDQGLDDFLELVEFGGDLLVLFD